MIFSKTVLFDNVSTSYLVLVFNCIAIWSTLPLTLRMFTTMREKRNLYFRATMISSWGCSLRAISYIANYFTREMKWWIAGLMSQIGWICMVSGFALVLWSRLGFIMGSERTKRYLLWMIIFNAVVFHTTMTVLGMAIWGMNANYGPQLPLNRRFGNVQRVFECVQIVFFNGQEILLSSLYIRAASVYLRDWSALSQANSRSRVKKAMVLLLVIQALVSMLDAAIITIDLLGLLQLKGIIHSWVYATKLELEFLVLNQLVEISKLGVAGLPSTSEESRAVADPARRLGSVEEVRRDVETQWDIRMQSEIKLTTTELASPRPCLESRMQSDADEIQAVQHPPV